MPGSTGRRLQVEVMFAMVVAGNVATAEGDGDGARNGTAAHKSLIFR